MEKKVNYIKLIENGRDSSFKAQTLCAKIAL